MAAASWYPGAALALAASASAVAVLVADARAGLTLAEHALEGAKRRATDACFDVEHTVAVLLAAPQTEAARINAHVERGVDAVVRQAGIVLFAACALADSVRVIGAVLRIVLQTYRSVFLCTLQLLVQAVAAVVDAASEAISNAVHDAAQLLRQAIRTAIAGGEGLADLAVDGANTVLGIFGKHIEPPKLAVPALGYASG